MLKASLLSLPLQNQAMTMCSAKWPQIKEWIASGGLNRMCWAGLSWRPNNHGFDQIIRICSDNPFLDVPATMELLNPQDETYDYVAYRMAGHLPSIKSHLGLWGEVVSLEALKRIKKEPTKSCITSM